MIFGDLEGLNLPDIWLADFLRSVSHKNGKIELSMVPYTTHTPLLFEIVNGVTVHMTASVQNQQTSVDFLMGVSSGLTPFKNSLPRTMITTRFVNRLLLLMCSVLYRNPCNLKPVTRKTQSESLKGKWQRQGLLLWLYAEPSPATHPTIRYILPTPGVGLYLLHP